MKPDPEPPEETWRELARPAIEEKNLEKVLELVEQALRRKRRPVD